MKLMFTFENKSIRYMDLLANATLNRNIFALQLVNLVY